MGDPFLRAYYSIYDMDYNRIGLVGYAQTVSNLFIQNNQSRDDPVNE